MCRADGSSAHRPEYARSVRTRSSHVRSALVGSLVLCCAAVGCGSSTTGTKQHAAPRAALNSTQVRVFAAVSAATGAPTVRISERPRGYCWTTSESVTRSAWRCFVGNFIHDPCFSGPSTGSGPNGTVICPDAGPWSGTGIEIQLTRPLPEEASGTEEGPSGLPWALQLVDGSNCLLLEGASSVVDGMRFNYSCKPDNLDLYGTPQRSSSLWTIYSGPADSSQLTATPIAVAWY
jgi:hypothetical protein